MKIEYTSQEPNKLQWKPVRAQEIPYKPRETQIDPKNLKKNPGKSNQITAKPVQHVLLCCVAAEPAYEAQEGTSCRQGNQRAGASRARRTGIAKVTLQLFPFFSIKPLRFGLLALIGKNPRNGGLVVTFFFHRKTRSFFLFVWG